MFNKFHHAREKGFTLVELLVVIGIIGILAMLLLPQFKGMRDRARIASCQSNLKNLGTQLEVYYTDQDSYPNVAEYAIYGGTLGKMAQCSIGATAYVYTSNAAITVVAGGPDTFAPGDDTSKGISFYVADCAVHTGVVGTAPLDTQLYVSPEGVIKK